MRNSLILSLTAVLLAGCTPEISWQSLRSVNSSISFQELQKDPDRYQRQFVLLGGEILSAKGQGEEIRVEVLQRPLDWQNRPEDTDVSLGRFLADFPAFKDPAVYAPGRKITVLGEVQGKVVQPIGGMEYTYPVVRVQESHLWSSTGSGSGFHIGIGIGGQF